MATSPATSSAPAPPPLPCLVFDYGGEQPCRTLFSISDGVHRACEVDELLDNLTWPTSHGWVLAWDPETTATFLWDPRCPGAGGRIALPPLAQPPPHWSTCALSGSPTDAAAGGGGGCTMLLSEPAGSNVLWCCHAGGEAWTRHEYDLGAIDATIWAELDGEEEGPIYSVHRLTSCRGRFYYGHSSTHCGVIDVVSPAAPPELSTVPLLRAVGAYGAAADVSTVEIDGELYTVYVFFHGCEFDTVADAGVYRMDFARRKHVRVDSVGDRAILAGSAGRFGGWCPAAEYGLLPNSVYWMSTFDGRLRVFDIELGTEEVQEPCQGVGACYPFWIIPPHP